MRIILSVEGWNGEMMEERREIKKLRNDKGCLNK